MLGGNPVGYAEHMLSTNPEFARFVRMNQGRPLEDVARDMGVNFDAIRGKFG